MISIVSLIAALGVTVAPADSAIENGGQDGQRQFAHIVFFTLADPSDANRERLIEACKQYLSGHEGTVHFSVGTLAAEMDRDVNQRDFDVSLHVIFDSRASHDRYQEHPRHLQFVEENKMLWNRVRVFDSDIHWSH
jgi:hypothetical protein